MGDDGFADVRDLLLAAGLDVGDLAASPVAQYERWLDEAVECGVDQAEAAVLSTASADGVVTGRHVLIRGIDERGFRFYSNYSSAKATQMADNPHVSLTVPWAMIGRQVRIEGAVERTSEADSDAYWSTRTRGSQLAARTSNQSTVTPDRDDLERRLAEETARWDGHDVPRPGDWGGYLVTPRVVEFWQARPHRLHDRLVYERTGDDERTGDGQSDGDQSGNDAWTITRLDP